MNYLLYFFQLVIIQYTTAQVFSSLGGRKFLNNQNCGNLPLATNFANNANLLANIGQTNQLSNNIIAQNNLGQEYLISNANYASNIPSNINLASSNSGIASSNIGLSNNNIGLTSNIGVSNIGSEVFYKKAPMYANVVKPPREYGIEFSSGALQVGGNVEVNGRMPFNANVALNGAVPAQGLGAVDYRCDKLGEEN
ncbi:uncharacterized protein LOC125238940 [Leguminivora glycinivorella]|uniref:uncharacterized protein LOC125238940 n=1 Tax=Leguminivora glycinivorella TaxID=1035111 RepID=UPI00200C741A|nr:uncharacterized protein LOC125238940 [Leguminivora glycinivorella]